MQVLKENYLYITSRMLKSSGGTESWFMKLNKNIENSDKADWNLLMALIPCSWVIHQYKSGVTMFPANGLIYGIWIQGPESLKMPGCPVWK